jgi:hypothetical protein
MQQRVTAWEIPTTQTQGKHWRGVVACYQPPCQPQRSSAVAQQRLQGLRLTGHKSSLVSRAGNGLRRFGGSLRRAGNGLRRVATGSRSSDQLLSELTTSNGSDRPGLDRVHLDPQINRGIENFVSDHLHVGHSGRDAVLDSVMRGPVRPEELEPSADAQQPTRPLPYEAPPEYSAQPLMNSQPTLTHSALNHQKYADYLPHDYFNAERGAEWDSKKKFDKANFKGMTLTRQNFDGVSLWGASFFGARFYNCSFCGADLSGADLTGAFFGNTDLSGANVGGADFSNADLQGATLHVKNYERAIINDNTKVVDAASYVPEEDTIGDETEAAVVCFLECYGVHAPNSYEAVRGIRYDNVEASAVASMAAALSFSAPWRYSEEPSARFLFMCCCYAANNAGSDTALAWEVFTSSEPIATLAPTRVSRSH